MTESLKIRNLVPNKEYSLQLRGQTIEGEHVGEWSHVFKFAPSGDTVPPPVPPIAVTNHHDTFIVTSPGYEPPADFDKLTVLLTNGTITKEYDMEDKQLNYPLELNTADFGEPEHTLTFTVRAYDNAGNTADSVDVEHTIPEPPAPVLTTTEHTELVELRWTTPDGGGNGGGDATALYSFAEEFSTNNIWLVTVSMVDGTVTKVAEWPTTVSTNEAPTGSSGIDLSGGTGWTFMENWQASDPVSRLVEFDIETAGALTAEPADGTPTNWADANPRGSTIGDGSFWTTSLAGGDTVAWRVDMTTGLDVGSVVLSASGGELPSFSPRCLYYDGVFYTTPQLDSADWWLLGWDLDTGNEISRTNLSAVVQGFPVGLEVDSQGRWWMAESTSATDYHLRRFDPDTGALLESVTIDEGWDIYGIAINESSSAMVFSDVYGMRFTGADVWTDPSVNSIPSEDGTVTAFKIEDLNPAVDWSSWNQVYDSDVFAGAEPKAVDAAVRQFTGAEIAAGDLLGVGENNSGFTGGFYVSGTANVVLADTVEFSSTGRHESTHVPAEGSVTFGVFALGLVNVGSAPTLEHAGWPEGSGALDASELGNGTIAGGFGLVDNTENQTWIVQSHFWDTIGDGVTAHGHFVDIPATDGDGDPITSVDGVILVFEVSRP